MTSIDVLRRTGWLASRSPEAQELILAGGRVRPFSAGETLYRYDDAPDGMYGLLSGNLAVSIPNDIGSEYVVFQATPGFWIGDLALFADQRRMVTVSALSEVRAFFIPQTHLTNLVRDNPSILREFYALTHANMALQMQLLSNLAIPNSEKRIAAFLLHIVSRLAAGQDWLDLPQERLAAMVALSVPTVQRVLKRISDKGLVEVGYGRIRVIDATALSQFAAE